MGVFRLGGWSPRVRTGFHVPGPTQEPPSGSVPGCAYGALTLCRRPSHAVRLPLDGSPPGAPAPGREALQPRGRYRLAPARSTVWPRSPFARRYSGNLDVDFSSSGYLDVSVPRVVPLRTMRSSGGCQDFSWRVRPFGDPRVEGCVPLTADYRSLPRPSSAPCAKHPPCALDIFPPQPGRDAVSRHLNVWVSHTLGDVRHRRSSCNLLYVCRLEDMYLISLYRRIDQINK